MRRLRNECGGSLILAMAFISLLGVFATSALSLVGVGTQTGTIGRARLSQQYAADAGIEFGVRALASDPTLCNGSGQTNTWSDFILNGRTVSVACAWVSGTTATGDRVVRLATRARGTDGTVLSSASALVEPEHRMKISGYRVRGEWSPPIASTTTTTIPPTTTTTVPPTTTTTVAPTTTTVPPTTTTTVPPTTTTTVRPTTTTTTAPTTTTTLPPAISGTYYAGRGSTMPMPLTTTTATTATTKTVTRGGTGAGEARSGYYVEWSMSVASTKRINGNVKLTLYAKGTSTSKKLQIDAYLLDCDSGGTCSTIDTATTTRASTTSAYQAEALDFGTVSTTIAAGHTLRVKVVDPNTANSNIDMSVSYDGTSTPSKLVFS